MRLPTICVSEPITPVTTVVVCAVSAPSERATGADARCGIGQFFAFVRRRNEVGKALVVEEADKGHPAAWPGASARCGSPNFPSLVNSMPIRIFWKQLERVSRGSHDRPILA
jgi:hypothetical protein